MLGNKEIMAKNIRHYMDLYGKTRKEMCQALGVKYTTFTDWINGHAYPRIDKIELMANYFGITKADLVEERSEPINPLLKKHLDNYSQLPSDWQVTIDDLILTLQSEQPNPGKIGEVIGKLSQILHS